MAQKKRKHGKVEARKSKPLIRFKPGVLLVLIFIAFAGCFALYMISATSQEDYWEREIVGSSETTDPTIPVNSSNGTPSAAVNPVPESVAVDTGHFSLCAWIGEVDALTTYYETASEMVFPDAVSSLSESEMRSIARKTAAGNPISVYFWWNTPTDAEKVLQFAEIMQEQLPNTAICFLSALPPAEDGEESRRVNEWNKTLFQYADNRGFYYVDISTPLKGNDGFLAPEYAQEADLYAAIGDEIMTHVVL